MTISELSVVAIIALLILNIGINYFVPIERRQLQNAAKDFGNNVANIQRLAVAENTDYKIVFNLENSNSYNVVKRNGTDFENVREISLPGETNVLRPKGLSNAIEFSSKGTVAQASTTIFVNGSYKLEVTCAVGTGKVSIKEIQVNATMYKSVLALP